LPAFESHAHDDDYLSDFEAYTSVDETHQQPQHTPKRNPDQAGQTLAPIHTETKQQQTKHITKHNEDKSKQTLSPIHTETNQKRDRENTPPKDKFEDDNKTLHKHKRTRFIIQGNSKVKII
jgi:hypothetical protein